MGKQNLVVILFSSALLQHSVTLVNLHIKVTLFFLRDLKIFVRDMILLCALPRSLAGTLLVAMKSGQMIFFLTGIQTLATDGAYTHCKARRLC